MYGVNGLEGWEIVAASGLCALAMVTTGSVIGALTSWFVFREPAVAPHPVAAAAQPRPVTAPVPAPEVGTAAVA